MMFLWPQSTSMLEMSPNFGVITTPRNKAIPFGIQEGRPWALDNGAFNQFDEDKFIQQLWWLTSYKSTCLFVVAPDFIANAKLTLESFERWHKAIKVFGYPVAFVAQDGQEDLQMPYPGDFDYLFVGGTAKWKMGSAAEECINQALEMDKKIHIGRVNSKKRYNHFKKLGAHSCDGTYPIYAPDEARKRIESWIE